MFGSNTSQNSAQCTVQENISSTPLQQVDKGQPLRRSHENPSIQRIYADFFGQPGGEVGEGLRHHAAPPYH